MRRREFLGVLTGAAAMWPVAADAQQPAMPVVGFLRSASAASSDHLVSAFRQGLNESGFIDGQNVAVEYRWADGQPDRLPGLAADLVRRQVAVIVVNGFAAPTVKAATTVIPIIFATGFDPIRTGLVASLSRPEGNVTGVVFTNVDLAAKQLALLHELVPKAGVIALLGDPTQPEFEIQARAAETASHTIGRQILIAKASSESEFDAAFTAMVQAGAGAVLVTGGPVFLNRRRRLVALAARYALPASYSSRDYLEVGGLMSYGASLTDAYRRVGTYAARILKGERPGELPVELATKFDLIINLSTAKGMGIEVPPLLLARADEVIE